MSRLWAWLFACVLLIGSTSRAGAQSQDQRAAELDREAREAFEQADYPRAAARFDEANRLVPHAELRYNAALSWEKAGARAQAADAYEGALGQGGLDADRAKKAQTALAGLKQTLGYIRVPSPIGGTVSVEHLSRAPIPAQFHLVPGQHEIEVERADGSKLRKSISVRAGEVVSVDVEPESVKPLAPRRAAPKVKRPVPAPAEREAVPSASNQSTWGWIAIGSGVALGGVAAYFGIQTQKASDDYEASNYTDPDARRRGVRDRAITNIALGGAVIGVGVGSFLLLSSGGAPRAGNRASLHVAVSGPRVDARLEF